MKNIFCNFCHTIEANEKRILLIMIVFTMLLRFFHVYLTYSHYGKTKWSDDYEYLYFGEQIALGNWNADWPGHLPFMQVGPALPSVIAGAIKVFHNPVWPVYIYNIFLTSLVVGVLFYIGKLVFNSKVAWLLAFWGIFYVDYFKYNPHLLKEATTYLFFPMSIYLLFKSYINEHVNKYIITSAISFTWLIHADERYIIYIPIIILSFLLNKTCKFSVSLRNSIFWLSTVFVLCTPWTMRNYHVHRQVVLISPRTTAFTSKLWGSNLLKSEFNSESAVYSHINRYSNAEELGMPYRVSPRLYGPTERYYRAFINFWQPTYFRPTYIQYGYRFQKWSLRHNILGLVFYGIFLPFYILGFFWLAKEKQWFGICIAVIPIFHSIIHTIMLWPLERYRSPVVFCVVLVALWAIVKLHVWLRVCLELKFRSHESISYSLLNANAIIKYLQKKY